MRQPKPFFRKQTESWYVQIDGRQIPLGKDEKAAWDKYHALLANRQPTTPETTVDALIGKFLEWCEKHREPATYKWYATHLKSFAEHIPAKLTLARLKTFHVTEWLDSRYSGRGDNYRHGACRSVARCFNWAVQQGHIENSPVKGMEKPRPHGRVAYLSPEQWAKVIAEYPASDPFHDFLMILRETGCRPQEARHAEARHFDRINKQLAFPAKESKGKREPRIIPLNDRALALITRLAMKYPEGKLFRNVDGVPWTRFAINCRFVRLKKKLGFEVFAYIFRHSFINDALLRGCDPVTLAIIVGHKDPSMILRVYQHLHLNTGHVRAALALATGEVPAKNAKLA